ncbi:MAG: DUF6064 family protein [Hydrogenophaga sp.]|jgi:hypothetical protein|uniref:DUF6064 family protein n=1 Tax=Hydrogenophaga sp. TaxID=1904254 RepID=UPI002632D620|nr:DUF6064 family protein [Hydrogenophaga sp.]MCV0441070.1 DUF6064 family protein [Hydrogenophaga sp.]
MSEWWSYRPVDFLMFAPRTYWRLFELQNAAWWPWHVLPMLLALALAVGLWRGGPRALRLGTAGLALAWAFVAWSFLWQRYAPINWAATHLAWAFAAQALGLLALSASGALLPTTAALRRRTGTALLLWAALAHPALAAVFHRPWTQAEVIGLAPDPTAIATLGLLLCADAQAFGPRALLWALRAVALAACLVSAATLAVMDSAQAGVLIAAALLAGVACWRGP